ncbi:MAG: AEC family transporter, partial [Acidobacteriota bacterium]
MEVFAGLAPVFVVLAAGVVARQAGLVDEAGAASLNRLVAHVGLPALLLLKVGTASLAESFSLPVVAVTTALVLVTAAVALALGRAWRLPPPQRGVLAQAAQRGNLAYVAFPVILAAGGEEALRAA